MSKMSKIDQIHLRAVMLCMSKMSKMGKEHTHTFWLRTSLIFNGFSIQKSFGKLRLRAFQPYHQILCILEIDQVHLRAVMLFMLETLEIIIIFNIHRIWYGMAEKP